MVTVGEESGDGKKRGRWDEGEVGKASEDESVVERRLRPDALFGDDDDDDDDGNGGGGKDDGDGSNSDEAGGGGGLRVNTAYAGRMERAGYRAAVQRVQARNGRVPLPDAMVAHLQRVLAPSRPPNLAALAGAVLASYGFQPATPLAPPADIAATASAATAALSLPPVKAFLRSASMHVRKHLYTPAAAAAAGGAAGVAMRSAPAAAVAPVVAARPAPALPPPPRPAPAAVVPPPPPPPSKKPIAPAPPPLKKVTTATPPTATTTTTTAARRHGRGAGRGRGLAAHGEPDYKEAHPSWRAHRRERARVAKAVSKSLHQGGIPVLEVSSAAVTAEALLRAAAAAVAAH